MTELKQLRDFAEQVNGVRPTERSLKGVVNNLIKNYQGGGSEQHLYQYDIEFIITHLAFDANENVIIRLFSNEQLTLTQDNFVNYLLQNYTNKFLVCRGYGYDDQENSMEYDGITVENIDGALSFQVSSSLVSTGKLSDTTSRLIVSETPIF